MIFTQKNTCIHSHSHIRLWQKQNKQTNKKQKKNKQTNKQNKTANKTKQNKTKQTNKQTYIKKQEKTPTHTTTPPWVLKKSAFLVKFNIKNECVFLNYFFFQKKMNSFR